MNRIEKMIKRVTGERDGILSCSVAPVGDRNYEKVLHDVHVLIEGGLDQLLVIFSTLRPDSPATWLLPRSSLQKGTA